MESQEAYNKADALATKLDGMAYGNGLIKAAILAAAGALPGASGVVGTITGTGLDIIHGDGGWTSVAGDVAWGSAGLVAGLAGGPLGSIFVSVAKFGYDQYKLYDMKRELEQALAASRLYVDFLNRLKNRIARHEANRSNTRQIVFENSCVARTFEFYGTGGNSSLWQLNMTLTREARRTAYGDNVYKGDFRMFVMYFMEGFLKDPAKAFNNSAGGALETAAQRAGGTFSYTDYLNPRTGGVAEIERTITGKATAIIDSYGVIEFQFEQEDDLKSVNIANLGYTGTWTQSAPDIGEFMRSTASTAFECNYSGSGNPRMRHVGQGDPQYWLHPIFYELGQDTVDDAIRAWEESFRNLHIDDLEFDEEAWKPWHQPNPPSQLYMMYRR